ncbi:tRNA uridine-5-carboxymethylaminomethyl(34) synthesis GTPase MnmE [Halothiobacillus sp. DCM-1]|uniref:tRNA uridine-5-carboxymethylaminomethyl(34) synthesis GTPase MnmE n=1 Tax=Halothiobacillus sp. DCM-1 TaxID=3112558 RepID=UPI0032565DFF
MSPSADTIAAIATAPGRGGVGIIRISGPRAKEIAEAITAQLPPERYARHTVFRDPDTKAILDDGLLIFFKGPHSYTGEDVVELQGHGGSAVLDLVLHACLRQGARLARPGEFTERAFLNGRIDLTQAEAVADLIDANHASAAQAAQRALQGQFGQRIQTIVDDLIQLRVYIESALDFAEEDIDFLADQQLVERIQALIQQINRLETETAQGVLIRDGLTIAIIGAPNAGKSSLLNRLTGEDLAIVTSIAGTTRDVLRAAIHLDGLPLHLVDTAGLRQSNDPIEQEGIRRAHQEIQNAQAILWLQDDHDPNPAALPELPASTPVLHIRSKIDLTGRKPGFDAEQQIYALSAKTGMGIDSLKDALKQLVGYTPTEGGQFLARRRHLDAIQEAKAELQAARTTLQQQHAGELCAEALRYAQNALERITGRFTSDDLLGEIFSKFCIGK